MARHERCTLLFAGGVLWLPFEGRQWDTFIVICRTSVGTLIDPCMPTVAHFDFHLQDSSGVLFLGEYLNCPLQTSVGYFRCFAWQQWGTLITLCKTLGGTLITSCRTVVGHFEYPLQSNSGVHWVSLWYLYCHLQGTSGTSAVNVLVGVGSILIVDACRSHAWLVFLVGY